jgi:glyoxylase-like metal-dependent hydrolase (beta-lactamase superfamily II)
VIDPVLDFDPRSGSTATDSIDRAVEVLRKQGLTLEWILETHAHADHLSGAQMLKAVAGGRVAIGEGIRDVQSVFGRLFDIAGEVPSDGRQFDRLLRDGDLLSLGEAQAEVLATPGHTSDSVSYRVGRHVFVGDSLFRPDYGTARCDFPGGDARALYRSISRHYALPAETILHFCHDYPDDGREPHEHSTVGVQRAANVHCTAATSLEQFVAMREARDALLATPNLLIPSIQVNIRAGHLPWPSANGVAYLKMPINTIGRAK